MMGEESSEPMKAEEMSETDSVILNRIAAELVCKLSSKLPKDDPVVANDGCIYERRELEASSTSGDCIDYTSCSQIKRVIELIHSSGKIDDKYINGNAEGDAQEKGINTYSSIRTKAEEGDVDSMIELAELYLTGKGIDQDEKAAYRWFQKASEQDFETGISREADCLLAGIGVEQDYHEGYQILVASDSEGRETAALRLYHYYDTGILGFRQDSGKANKFLNRLKTISPDLSDENIQQMKLELSQLISLPSSSDNEKQEGTQPMAKQTTVTSADDDSKDDIPNSGKITGDQYISSETLLKQCYSCNVLKSKEDFSTTQWKQPVRTGRCKDCCEEDVSSPSTKQQKVIFSTSETSEANEHTSTSDKQHARSKSHSTNDSAKAEEVQRQSQGNVKQCYECKHSKQQMEFTASQWKKRIGTGKCIDCVSKTAPQWASPQSNRLYKLRYAVNVKRRSLTLSGVRINGDWQPVQVVVSVVCN